MKRKLACASWLVLFVTVFILIIWREHPYLEYPYLEANFPVCLQFGYTTSSMIRRDHAKSAESDFSAKANSFCFVAACNRKFVQDLFWGLEDALH